jgi:hypothetical protein
MTKPSPTVFVIISIRSDPFELLQLVSVITPAVLHTVVSLFNGAMRALENPAGFQKHPSDSLLTFRIGEL